MYFKFLTNNEVMHPIPPPLPVTEDAIAHAYSVGRERYLNGNDIDENPFHAPALYEAFEEGWELEQDYDILRQAQQRANEGF